MGRSTAKPFFSDPSSNTYREEKLLLQLQVAGQLIYLLTLSVMLFFALGRCRCRCRRKSRGGGRVQTNGGDTSSGQITTEVHHNFAGQISGEVSVDVAGGADDDGDTNSGQIARNFRAVADYTRGSKFGGGVRLDVAGDDDGGTISGEIAMGPTSLVATMPNVFN